MEVSLKTENGTWFLFFYLQINWAVYFTLTYSHSEGLPSCLSGKESACQFRRCGSIPRSGRSPGVGNSNSLQYSCLENPQTEELGGLQSMRSQRVGHN